MSLCLHMKRRFLLLTLLELLSQIAHHRGLLFFVPEMISSIQQFSIIDQIGGYLPAPMLQNMLLQVRLELTTPAFLIALSISTVR